MAPCGLQRGPAPDDTIRITRLISAFPALGESGATAILNHLKSLDRLLPDGGRQDVQAFLRDAAAPGGLCLSAEQLELFRQALCLPAASVVSLFSGAEELLVTIQRLGLRCALVSIAEVRSGDDYSRPGPIEPLNGEPLQKLFGVEASVEREVIALGDGEGEAAR